MRPSSSPASAILLAALGIGLLSLMDATIKGLSDRYGVTEIAFARYLVGTVVMAGVLGALRPGWPSAETWRTNGVRAVLVVATALCFFHGLSVLPLAEALALSFLSPVFIALFAALLLRERVRPPVWAGLAVGFLGVGIVVAGQVGAEGAQRGAGSAWGIAAILASALTYALSMVLLRARARHDPVVTIVAIQNAGPAAMLAAPAAWTWTPVAAPDWALLVLVGLLGVAGHLVLSRAYAQAEASRLAAMEYTALLWAIGLGYFAFGEVPGVATLAGAGLILAGSALAAKR
ncbi:MULTISPECIES: DMT family transporter [Methylobacterium]|jgi:drug/metabolite transporter (DMT)-like permease|uniref:DMT family transporter n=2 Tax=Methylobacteriaceae TaxID=119045 RepID=UPI0008E50B02|nr:MULTISPECIES: DMT family transporter [Methylobacterium]MBZ6413607.1 DMT family transporter [Methylobacterium sp.]MBK3397288.1 DMT family transporter [Methylobacterium ajmalii]MBK3412647.1 DMT family transporter [Methylobacterium ajmalii]MBK3425255.1 DMT family transporter [Methylobacterium ajmalii]SFF36718.1 S-adenosylmethionine uptake transporter [Methylobacterium sp. yr596]